MLVRRLPAPAVVGALLLAAGHAGCSFQSNFDGTNYRCGVGDVCPSGFMCVDGYCRTSGADDGGPDGASGGDGGGPDASVTARCGTISLLDDDFEDSVTGVQWWKWADSGVVVNETGGQVVAQIAAGTADAWGGYTSSALYDLTDGTIETTVAQVGGRYTILELRSFDGPRAQLLVEDGTSLLAGVYSTGNDGVRATATYVPSTHRHWRFREHNGWLYWETSPDGNGWTELHSETLPFPPDHVHGIVSGGGQLAAAGEAQFDHVNPDPFDGRFCPGTALSDDFSAAPFRPLWDDWTETGCTMTETGGEVVMDFTGAADVWCGASSSHIYDLRGSSITWEVSAAASASMFLTYVQVIVPGDDTTRLEIGMEDGTMWFLQDVASVDTGYAEATFSASNHRFWRLAESAGRALFQTSPDGTGWTTQLDVASAFDLSEVVAIIGAGTWGTGPGTAVTTRFAGVNAP